MKNYILLLALSAMTLGGCTNMEDPAELTDQTETSTTLEKGKSILRVSIKNKSLPTAPATRGNIAATIDEKIINRLDFYVFPTTGNMQRFENVKLTALENGKLSTEFKISGNGTSLGETRIVAIANPKADLSKVRDYADLEMLITDELSEPALTDFMMYWEQVVPALVDDNINEIGVDLERLVARIDVVNSANNKIFILQSARVLNAKVQSFVQPHYKYYAYEGNIKDLAVCDYVVDKKITSRLYTYESGNQNEQATAVEIKGLLRGEDFTKVVKFYRGTTSNALRIERNNLYKIEIKGTDVDKDVSFEITIADWDNGEDIEVELPSEVPDYAFTTLDGFTFNAITNTLKADNATEATEKVQIITCTSSATLGIRFDYPAEETAKWIYCDETLTTSDYDAISGKMKTVFTIKATPNNAVTGIPLVATIYSKADYTRRKSFIVQATPALVEVEVAAISWATFNLGGKKVGDLGATYQGGRITAFPNNGPMPTLLLLTHSDVPNVPIESVAVGAKFEHKFIGFEGDNGFPDWNTDAFTGQWMNDGTKGTKDPCPDGWRIPTTGEIDDLIDDTKTEITFEADGAMKVTDRTNRLNSVSFPLVGMRALNGVNDKRGLNNAHYYRMGNPNSYLVFTPENAYVGKSEEKTNAYGGAIRCVKL